MITVLGASGFVGRHLVAHLQARGQEVTTPPRGDDGLYVRDLGHVIYAIGVTADFRRRPFETVEAHVSLLAELLRRARFSSFLYLSSTRVYQGAAETAETARLGVQPADPSDLYNLTKLTGEALCLTRPDPAVRVARLSNVYGFDPESENFLPSLLRDALETGRVRLGLGRGSEKDYVAVEDVVERLADIALGGRQRLYNVASGGNLSNGALLDAIAAATGCTTEVAPDAPEVRFPPIDTRRLAGEFGACSRRVVEDLPDLVARLRAWRTVPRG